MAQRDYPTLGWFIILTKAFSIPKILSKWEQFCWENSLPQSLKDIMRILIDLRWIQFIFVVFHLSTILRQFVNHISIVLLTDIYSNLIHEGFPVIQLSLETTRLDLIACNNVESHSNKKPIQHKVSSEMMKSSGKTFLYESLSGRALTNFLTTKPWVAH